MLSPVTNLSTELTQKLRANVEHLVRKVASLSHEHRHTSKLVGPKVALKVRERLPRSVSTRTCVEPIRNLSTVNDTLGTHRSLSGC